jgi:hypothetical protein
MLNYTKFANPFIIMQSEVKMQYVVAVSPPSIIMQSEVKMQYVVAVSPTCDGIDFFLKCKRKIYY